MNNSTYLNNFKAARKIEKLLGLNKGYFSKALFCKYNIKATIIKDDSAIVVRLDDEIAKHIDAGYVCIKICPDDILDYDFTVKLTQKTTLGFYK